MWEGISQSTEVQNRTKKGNMDECTLHLSYIIYLLLPLDIGKLGSWAFRFRLGLTPSGLGSGDVGL